MMKRLFAVTIAVGLGLVGSVAAAQPAGKGNAKSDEAKEKGNQGGNEARGNQKGKQKAAEGKAKGKAKADEAKEKGREGAAEGKAKGEDRPEGEPHGRDEKVGGAPEAAKKPLPDDQLEKEAQKHAARMARIERLEALAEENRNDKLLEKAKMLRDKEMKRHERKMEKLRDKPSTGKGDEKERGKGEKAGHDQKGAAKGKKKGQSNDD